MSVAQAHRFDSSNRAVIKIGSALLIDPETGAPRADWLAALAEDVAAARAAGTEIVIVSSGAIAVGRNRLGLGKRALRLEEKQAAAATGQIHLAHAYQEALARHGMTVAQVLLTLEDSEERRRYLNARNTIATLLKLGIVPVVNENDTVATAEIRFGDNDRLAARVAQMISADTLVLFSDIDGLYTADPRSDETAEHIAELRELTPEIEAMAAPARPGYSSGGMVTKLVAARIGLGAGCRVVIADGRAEHPLARLTAGNERATWFVSEASPRTARKHWIAGTLQPAGALIVDAGVERALKQGKSLLPAGVTAVEGEFERGDAVLVTDAAGRKLAQGLTAYSAGDARLIAGHKSREIEQVLGYRGRDEIIHRDDLVLL